VTVMKEIGDLAFVSLGCERDLIVLAGRKLHTCRDGAARKKAYVLERSPQNQQPNKKAAARTSFYMESRREVLIGYVHLREDVISTSSRVQGLVARCYVLS
jgi:hypothetical protein